MSIGRSSKGLFALGGTGAIILTVASVIMAVVGLWGLSYPFWERFYRVEYLILITGLVLLFMGSIFVGIALYAFYRQFEHPLGIAGLVFGVTCSTALLVFGAIGMFPPSYVFDSYSPSQLGLTLFWLGLLLFGTTLVIWGITSIVVRKSTNTSGLSLATGIILIVAGCFVPLLPLTSVGFVLLLAAQIMNAIVLLKMSISPD